MAAWGVAGCAAGGPPSAPEGETRGGVPAAPIEAGSLRERAALLLAAAVRIPSVNPPGGEAPVARLFVDELRRAGVEARLVPTPSPEGGPRRGAAWARVRGSGKEAPLLLLSHLDVVEARPEDWRHDPFGGEIRRGRVIGRGTLDAKGITVVHALALEALARRAAPLERDVILLAVPDEEAGGRLGLGWLLREQPGLFRGVRYALAEGGSIRTGGRGPPLWSVSVAEKSPCWIELRAHGTPGHAGTPGEDAAVPRLVAALDRVRRVEWPVQVVPEVERMFRALSEVASPSNRDAYRDLGRALESDPEFRRGFLRHRTNAALVRNTVSITVLEGARHTNVVPAEARAHLDARLLPGERCDEFEARIRAIIDDPRVATRRLLSHASTRSSIDTPLYRAIVRLAARIDPGATVVPRMSAGSSDAHWLREREVVTYGFVPRWLSAEDTRGIHGPEESIAIDDLERGVASLVELLEELDEIE